MFHPAAQLQSQPPSRVSLKCRRDFLTFVVRIEAGLLQPSSAGGEDRAGSLRVSRPPPPDLPGPRWSSAAYQIPAPCSPCHEQIEQNARFLEQPVPTWSTASL